MKISASRPLSGYSLFLYLRYITLQIFHSLLLNSYGMFRTEGGIPPLVELLEFNDRKVQRAAAGALRTLAFKNDDNKNQVFDFAQRLAMTDSFVIAAYKNEKLQIVACNALPTLVLMLKSEDPTIHYEAVRH